MTASPILLGVDGGNTKTVAVVAGADGTILGGARILGTSDIYAVPPDVAVAIQGRRKCARGGFFVVRLMKQDHCCRAPSPTWHGSGSERPP